MPRLAVIASCTVFALTWSVAWAAGPATAPATIPTTAPAPRPTSRAATPPLADQQRAEKEIREVFAAQFADRRAEARAALAAKLLAQADDGHDAPATRYALYRLAAALAASAGNVSAALRALDQLDALYTGDLEAARADALRQAATVMTPDTQRGVAEGYLDLLDAAVAREDLKAAADYAARLATAARAAQDPALSALAQQRVAGVAAMQAELPKVAEARKQLTAAGAAGNPQACETVGTFTAFLKNDWPAALPLLAKANVKDVSALAAREQAARAATPPDPKEVAAVADAWWDLGDAQPPARQPAVRQHAAALYELVADDLAGLTRKKADQRIAIGYGLADPKFDPSQLPRILAAGTWTFIWPDGCKPMRFSPTLQILEGANWNESRARLVGNVLEFYTEGRSTGPRLRLTYYPEGNYFFQPADAPNVTDHKAFYLLPPATWSRARMTPRDREIARQLQTGEWELNWGFTKWMTFGPAGQITKGQNENENAYRVYRGRIELINKAGAVFSRFEYDKKDGKWVHDPKANPDAVHSSQRPDMTLTLRPVQ